MKKQLYNELLKELGICEKCVNIKNKIGKDCSLINIYNDYEFCRNISSIWTDWFNRLDSKIMIIGQDCGPFNDMEMFNEQYIKNPSKSN